MRVATLLSVVVIATLTAMGPALAYGPSASSPSLSQTSEGPRTAPSAVETGQVQLAFAVIKEIDGGYLLVRSDSGRQQQYRNCESLAYCIYGPIDVFLYRNNATTMSFDCRDVGGCVIVGKR